MTLGLGLVALAIALATVTFVLIIHELHLRALNIRVSNAVLGIPGRSAPLQDMTGWLSSLGTRYRRYSWFLLPFGIAAVGFVIWAATVGQPTVRHWLVGTTSL